jgi:hypothetical protein
MKAAMGAKLDKKLGIRPGMQVALLDAPAEAAKVIRACAPPGVRWKRSLGASQFDLIFFWPKGTSDLSREFARLQQGLVPDGAIWAVMPKKEYASERGVFFTWEEMQAEGLRGDLVDNKVASITSTDYGTRFVIRRELRRL